MVIKDNTDTTPKGKRGASIEFGDDTDDNIFDTPNDTRTPRRTIDMQRNMRQAERKIDEASDVTGRAVNRGLDAVSDFADSLKSDYDSEMSEDMTRTGRFGFKVYFYIILFYAMLALGGSTTMLLVAGFVTVTEKDKKLIRIMLSGLILYYFCRIGFYTSGMIINLIDNLPFIGRLINEFGDLLDLIEDFLYPALGIIGMLRAKSGKSFEIKWIKNLF